MREKSCAVINNQASYRLIVTLIRDLDEECSGQEGRNLHCYNCSDFSGLVINPTSNDRVFQNQKVTTFHKPLSVQVWCRFLELRQLRP